MSELARRCFVAGRVQGVWYRGSTAKKARELGVSGYARNLADGRVEVLAVGDDTALVQLKSWLWEGPVAADVTSVQCEPVDPVPEVSGFSTY